MSDKDTEASIAQTQETSTAGPSFEAVVRALGAAYRAVEKAQSVKIEGGSQHEHERNPEMCPGSPRNHPASA